MVKVIGVDPGLAGTGIGIVKGSSIHINEYSYGSIETSKNMTLPKRLEKIYSRLFYVLDKEKPDLMVVEDVFSLHKYPKSGIILGKVVGVILLAGVKAGIPVSEIAVREVKKILSGNGSASKSQLEKTVRYILNHPDPIRPYHASDAMALSIIGLYRYEKLMISVSSIQDVC